MYPKMFVKKVCYMFDVSCTFLIHFFLLPEKKKVVAVVYWMLSQSTDGDVIKDEEGQKSLATSLQPKQLK